MARIALLVAVALIGCSIAGCFGPAATPTESPVITPEDSPTPSLTPEPTPPPTTPIEYDIDVPECPDRPESFAEDSVVEYAMQFERAYVARDHLRGSTSNITYISVNTENPNATRIDIGWIVHFTTIGPNTRSHPSYATETLHADGPLYTANYLITDDRVVRRQTVAVTDPRMDGQRVYCPPRR